jgi:hypothetical protein
VADSYRLAVLKRLTVLIEGTTVTPFTGVELPATLAGVVFRGRSFYGEDDPKTMISILEDPRPSGGTSTEDGRRYETWSIFIQGWCPDDKANPTDPCYSLADDIELRLDRITRVLRSSGQPKYPDDYLLGAALDGDGTLIAKFESRSVIVRPATQGVSSKSFFYIPVQVGLARISVG